MERDEEVSVRPAGLVALSWLFLGAVLAASGLLPQARSDAPPADAFYAVAYVESAAGSSTAAATALEQYRAASRAVDGFIRIDIFEQIGRSGHFAVVEVWRDQKTFDARHPSIQKTLTDTLAPVRVSGYDQRPYKVLSTAASSPAPTTQAVYVVSHVDVAPNPQVPDLLRRLAERSRTDPANLRFDVVQHTMRANHFTVIEGWRDQRALDAHVAAAHTRQYRDELQPFTGSPLDERVYRIVEVP